MIKSKYSYPTRHRGIYVRRVKKSKNVFVCVCNEMVISLLYTGDIHTTCTPHVYTYRCACLWYMCVCVYVCMSCINQKKYR